MIFHLCKDAPNLAGNKPQRRREHRGGKDKLNPVAFANYPITPEKSG
jgi:hypothetical protein